MREIKFRAWDKKNKKYFKECGGLSFKGNGVRFMWTDWETDDTMVTDLLTEDSILLQFTGLKDKNNKEIYEGDIISISRTALNKKNPTITEVYFDKGAFRWKHNDGSGSVLNFNSTSIKEGYESITQDIEVIGNIYENQELVEK